MLELTENSKGTIFVKLGGSAITHKEKEFQENLSVIDLSSSQISELYEDFKLILAHGGGGFAHPVAEKHNVSKGIEKCKPIGLAKTRSALQNLNSIVVKSLISHKVPAITISPYSCSKMENGRFTEFNLSPIHKSHKIGAVPLLHGDIVYDSVKGCSIASTEMIFSHLSTRITPKRIVIGTNVDGVFWNNPDSGKRELVEEINSGNLAEVLSAVEESKTSDVTGGMRHKIEELYNISKHNIEIFIVNLSKKNYLSGAILGKPELSTRIKAGE